MSLHGQKVFCIDENISPLVAKAANKLFQKTTITHIRSYQLQGTEDIELIHALHARGVDALVTLDRRQLVDPLERQALKDAHLHWVGLPEKTSGGLELFIHQTTALINAVRLIESDWPSVPTKFEVIHPRQTKIHHTPI